MKLLCAVAMASGVSSWNQKKLDYEIETKAVSLQTGYKDTLKLEDSRLRDGNRICPSIMVWFIIWLEKKRNSITRSKHTIINIGKVWFFSLKRKETRLRDRNSFQSAWTFASASLEKKRNSITRLKHFYDTRIYMPVTINLKSKETRLRDWNTSVEPKGGLWIPVVVGTELEMKRNSITRLKLPIAVCVLIPLPAWKEKKLDYEIETWQSLPHATYRST